MKDAVIGSLVVSGCITFSGLVGAGLSIPLLLDKIPRNPLYGFRTKRTLSSDEIWYPANRFAAKGMFVWGLFNILVGLASFAFHPLTERQQMLLVLSPASIIVFCFVAMWWVRKHFPVSKK